MAPRGDGRRTATLQAGTRQRGKVGPLTSQFLRYPKLHKQWLWDKSTLPWLKEKQSADDVGDLWRVHDDLYDLSAFMARHPGGRFWLEVTQGHDVTELFEASHPRLTGEPERQLARCHVRPAAGPRNAPYTFREDGFYRTLKRRAAPVLRGMGTGPSWGSTLVTDACLGLFLAAAAVSGLLDSRLAAAVSGVFLMLAIGAGHNFLHQRDNWRMLCLDLSFLSSAEWRVSHAFSHHMFPNTAFDLEVTGLEPVILFLPQQKGILSRGVLHFVIYQLSAVLAFFLEGAKRALRWVRGEQRPRPENFLPLLHLLLVAACCLVSSPASLTSPSEAIAALAAALGRALPLWAITHATASYVFLSVGLAAGHHHPRVFHDGDAPLEDQDWGLQQLDAVGERTAVRASPLMALTLFADHGLHHMFPTVDHGRLARLYPVFEQVCAEFGVRFRYFSLWEAVWGQYLQMGRQAPRLASDLVRPPQQPDTDVIRG